MSAAATAGAAAAAPGGAPAPKLTSIASIKRACVEGASLEIVDAGGLGHLQATIEAGPRPIVRVQGNAIAVRGCHRAQRGGGFAFDPDVESWIYWPKRGEIYGNGDDTFAINYGPGIATYRVLPPAS